MPDHTDSHPADPGDTKPRIRVASRSELPELLTVQRDAFLRVARMFDIPVDRLPALAESVEDLASLMDAGYVFLGAWNDGRAVGTVRFERRGDGVVEVGRLAVAETHLRRGIATDLMLAVERVWPVADRLELFTGAQATVPLTLYSKLGYRTFDRPGEDREGLVWLAKDRRRE